jgi:hypothetical protein
VTLSGRTVIGTVIALALGGAAWVLWPAGEESPKERIEREVTQMARAAEKRDLGFVMERISPRFRSSEGWGRDDLKGVLAAELLRGEWVRVFVADLDVTVDTPQRAHLKGKFLLGRSDAKTLKELAAQSQVQGYEIDGALELEGGQWRFLSATHLPLDPSQFL